MHKQSTARSRAVAVLAIVTMALTLMMMSAPDASAHSGKFEHDDLFFGTSCPSSHMPNGATGQLLGRATIGCTPLGYSPIGSDAGLCSEAAGVIIGSYCTFDRARPCGASASFLTTIGNNMCLRQALVLSQYAAGDIITPTTICIETELVQQQSPSLKVSNIFRHDNTRYEIISGAATCTFNCYNKWDINCDGKLGDFCSVEYDLSTVGDVGKCMADLGITPTS